MPSYKNFGLTPSLEGVTPFESDGTTINYNTVALNDQGENSYTYNFQSFHKDLGSGVDNELFVIDTRKVNIIEVLFLLQKPITGPYGASDYFYKYAATLGQNVDFEGTVYASEHIGYHTVEGANFDGTAGILSASPNIIEFTEASPNIYNVKFTMNPTYIGCVIKGIYQFI